MENPCLKNSQNWHETLTQGGTVLFTLTDTRSACKRGIARTAQPMILARIDAAAHSSAAGNTECRSLSLYGCGDAV